MGWHCGIAESSQYIKDILRHVFSQNKCSAYKRMKSKFEMNEFDYLRDTKFMHSNFVILLIASRYSAEQS